MNEKALQILEQYDVNLLRSFGGRGALMLETDQGLKILKEFAGSRTKLPYEQRLLDCLEERGVCKGDKIVLNRAGEAVTLGEYETPYILKNWPSGRECDTKNEEELRRSVETLGRIHKALRGVWQLEGEEKKRLSGADRREEFERHNRELRRVQNFIRSKHKKGCFELLYLKHAEYFMKEGQQALKGLLDSGYGELYREALQEERVCHGEFIHHNILVNRQEIAVVNFQRCEMNVQINDLSLFLRKIMEKQSWNETLAARMLAAYERELPLSGEERRYLSLCLYYPEKVWKLAHHYYHTNKAWVPEKSAEKLEIFLEQDRKRKQMIKRLFSADFIDF